MNKVKYVRLEKEDGTYSESIPLSVDADQIDMSNGKDLQDTIGDINIDEDGNIASQLNDLQDTIGNIDIDEDGNIANQLNNLNDNKINVNDIIDNLNTEQNNKPLSAKQGYELNVRLNKKPYYYNTVTDMKADTGLKVGDVVQTLGLNTKGDGNTGLYNIVSDSSLIVDNYNIFNLDNQLKAVRINEKHDTIYVTTGNTDLNDYLEDGTYFFEPPYTPINIPIGVNGFLEVKKGDAFIKQVWYRAGTPSSNDYQTFVRTKSSSGWGKWKRYTMPGDLYWTKTNHEILSKYAGYFVDGVNGDDNNDGKTSATAFKTLAPIWEAVKQGDMEIRFSLAGGSTYIWDPYIINNLSMHILCYGTGDITIQMPDEPIAFYDCHINFRGNVNQKLIFVGAQSLYLDSGSADLQYVDMQFKYTNWAAGSRIRNSDMRSVDSNYSNMYIDTCNVSNIYATSSNITFASCIFLTEYSESNTFMDLFGCNILIFGPTKVDMKGAVNTGTFMKMTGGHLSQLSAMNAINVQNNVLYNLGLQAVGAIIVATTARFNSYSNVATTASSLTDGSICTANL